MTEKDLSDLLHNKGLKAVHKHYQDTFKDKLITYGIWLFIIGLVIGSVGACIKF